MFFSRCGQYTFEYIYLFTYTCIVLRVDLNPQISKTYASWMSVWNISANYVLVPVKFNLNWNIWKPFLNSSPLDFSRHRLGNTKLVGCFRFHSFSLVVKWPELNWYIENIFEYMFTFLAMSIWYRRHNVTAWISRSLVQFFLKHWTHMVHAHRFEVGLGISWTNADSQWNTVYNAFHRIFCCGNETIRR